MGTFLASLAVTDTMGTRLAVCAVAGGGGAVFISAGLTNVRTGRAEEARGRWLDTLLGRSDSYAGNTAVVVGMIRLVCGVGAIVFGIVFLFAGPFLA